MSPAALAPLLLALAVKATLLLGIAAVIERAVLRRRASAAARHLLWTVAIGGTLLLPVLTLVLPGWRVAAIVASPQPAVAARAPEPTAVEPPRVERSLPAPQRTPATSLPDATPSPLPAAGVDVPWTLLLLGVYASGALLLLGRVAAEQRTVRRLAREATPVRDAAWHAMLGDAAASLGVRRPVRLLRDAGATMPLTWGVRRPTVLVPADADAWPAERRRAVLLHELAHVARRDCLTQTLAAIACALYWPLPGVWWAAARLRVERELACDDRALGEPGMRPHDYAAQLLAIARGHRAPTALTALAVTMASPSQLEVRLRAAIDGARPRRAPGRWATAVAALLTAVLLLPLAALRAGVAPAAQQPPIAPSAPRVARPSPVVPPVVSTMASAVVPTSPSVTRPSVAPVGVASAVLPSVSPPAPSGGGRWWIRRATAQEAGPDGPAVHVMLNTNGLNTFVVPLARLDRLTPEQLASARGPVQFRLRQDAGTLRFDGTLADGKGSGTFDFVPDQAFADTLVARGMARPTPAQLFSMGIHGLPLALLDELQAHGYARPTTGEYARLALTGVDAAYVRAMSALGYRLGTVSSLVRLYNGGVGPAFVRALAAQGYDGLTPSDLLRLSNQGISADFVRVANAGVTRRLTVSELVERRQRVQAGGIPRTPTPRATDAPAASGPRGDTPTTGRWVVHRTRDGMLDLELFWDDATNWRRWIPASALDAGEGGAGLRIAQDAGTFALDGALRDGGGGGAMRFRPNRAYAATLRALGVTGVDTVGDHQLKNLAWGGVSAVAVRDFQALGYAPLALDEAIDAGIFGVTPTYARAVRAAGVPGAETMRGVIDLRHRGVRPGDARQR